MLFLPYMPKWFKSLFPGLIYSVDDADGIYLTFDDGPCEVTLEVLDLLDRYQAKATFFCIGENVKKHPDILDRLRKDGHAIGGHTMKHESAWQTDKASFLRSTNLCQEMLQTKLFRPPYGRITPSLIKILNKDYKLIYWNVLTGDYHRARPKEDCIKYVEKYTKPGSIIVFHDSEKAKKNMLPSLEACLKLSQEKGWKCRPLSPDLPLL